VGWGKVACWTTKAAISLKLVKIEEKFLWMAYRNSPTLFRMVPSPTLCGVPFSKIGGSQPPPKTPIALISGTLMVIFELAAALVCAIFVLLLMYYM